MKVHVYLAKTTSTCLTRLVTTCLHTKAFRTRIQTHIGSSLVRWYDLFRTYSWRYV